MSTTLCLDIGSGTQDVLLYSPDIELENCPKFVLPSPAKRVAARLAGLTEAGQSVYLAGGNMGGGFFGALKAHLQASLPMAAHPDAALAVFDDPARLESMGVQLLECAPEGYVPLLLADYDEGFWRAFLAAAGLEQPDQVVACAQDHGHHQHTGNRKGRFELWERFLVQEQGRPENLVFSHVPPELTRLRTLQRAIGGGLVSDTGSAAVLGALWDGDVAAQSRKHGITLVNIGNSHVLAFLLYAGRMWGVYEHHTGLMNGVKLWDQLQAFREGRLTFEHVFDDNGHGCLRLDVPPQAGGFAPTFVLGPRRSMLAGCPVSLPCPGGDMMLAGCFGLLKGRELRSTK
ncbi:MAG: DUF1786 domain-containing protein [Okeania sp. SIO3B3]|nr:DUF1786 domain-containing protein [Okeania sp. SIO3B3]